MLHDIPLIVESSYCLACDGCCRFLSEDTEWRPKAEKDVATVHILDEKRCLKTKFEEGTIFCSCFSPDHHLCDIYEQRPFECRLYPFLIVRQGGQRHIGLHLSCPFVQENRQGEVFFQTIEALKQFCQTELMAAFLKENDHLGSSYTPYLDEIEMLFLLD